MDLLLDSRTLPPAQRLGALRRAFVHATGMPVELSSERPAELVDGRVQALGYADRRVCRLTGSDLRITRPARPSWHVPRAAGERFILYFHTTGRVLDSHSTAVESVRQLLYRDASQPFSSVLDGLCSTVFTSFTFAELGLPAEQIRRAGRRLSRSPLHRVALQHFLALSGNERPAVHEGSAAILATATTELVRALIVSADSAGADSAGADAGPPAAPGDARAGRIMAYVRRNLRDPGLNATTVASAHNMSVRSLYNIWSSQPVTLAEWIIGERLEGARQDLACGAMSHLSIMAISQRWGFSDATHFSRRFRNAYALSPREWRAESASRNGGSRCGGPSAMSPAGG